MKEDVPALAGVAFASPLERFALAAFACACAGAILFHIVMSTLFVLPPNPLDLTFRPIVLRYTDPLFEQFWNVFAPTPIDSDLSVFARTKRFDAAERSASPWVDISALLISEVRANKFSEYGTLKLVQMTLAVALQNDKTLGRRVPNRAEAAAMLEPRHRPIVLEALSRLALYVGGPAFAAAGGDEVQLALANHKYPRFTHRAEADDVHKGTTTLVYPWLPIKR